MQQILTLSVFLNCSKSGTVHLNWPHVFPANSITGLFLRFHVPLPQTANDRTAQTLAVASWVAMYTVWLLSKLPQTYLLSHPKFTYETFLLHPEIHWHSLVFLHLLNIHWNCSKSVYSVSSDCNCKGKQVATGDEVLVWCCFSRAGWIYVQFLRSYDLSRLLCSV